jgi:hypothetical protein
MNIKLHTPKSLKTGSGMGSLKQFLLSLFATTVSIALTFGTAAIIDYNKKQSEKHEIVMMVMYDMYNSLKSIEECDSAIQQSMLIQRQIAEDTTKFETLRYQGLGKIPMADYTEATERIFSTSIETINTVGNVLFTEKVSEFYQMRKQFKTMVCDSIWEDVSRIAPSSSVKAVLSMDYFEYALLTNSYTNGMERIFEQCKQMMDVTDEEIDAYREQKKQWEKKEVSDELFDSKQEELIQLQDRLNDAKSKLKIE